jgi:hypothetical protein
MPQTTQSMTAVSGSKKKPGVDLERARFDPGVEILDDAKGVGCFALGLVLDEIDEQRDREDRANEHRNPDRPMREPLALAGAEESGHHRARQRQQGDQVRVLDWKQVLHWLLDTGYLRLATCPAA